MTSNKTRRQQTGAMTVSGAPRRKHNDIQRRALRTTSRYGSGFSPDSPWAAAVPFRNPGSLMLGISPCRQPSRAPTHGLFISAYGALRLRGVLQHNLPPRNAAYARIERMVDRLAGVMPEAVADGKGVGGNGLMEEALGNAIRVSTAMAAINEALDRLDRALP